MVIGCGVVPFGSKNFQIVDPAPGLEHFPAKF
jgi:hypothetical protein